jgi:hypothetical protein
MTTMYDTMMIKMMMMYSPNNDDDDDDDDYNQLEIVRCLRVDVLIMLLLPY